MRKRLFETRFSEDTSYTFHWKSLEDSCGSYASDAAANATESPLYEVLTPILA
jgi:hypothetical protein